MEPFLTSTLFSREGFLHGFTTRSGGVSSAPFETLNLGRAVGDDPTHVEHNHVILAAAAGFDLPSLATVSQVHGDRVILAAEAAPGVEADAILASHPGEVAGVKVADCVPILLANRDTGAVAAVHAGWRGTKKSIAARAAGALGDPRDLVAAIGPCIRSCCYEVSAELAEAFEAEFGRGVILGRKLDLVEVNRRQLLAAGLPTSQVDIVPGCTSCDPGLFFSHRRDRGRTGRHLAFAQAREGADGGRVS